MADDKHLTDGDRIKELLAQLRATMSLEEEASESETKQAPQEDGYAIALEELLSGEEEDETEDASLEMPLEDEDTLVEDEEGQEALLPEEEELPEQTEYTTGTSVSAMLSSFFTIDEKDRHGQITISDSFLNGEDQEGDSAEETEDEEGEICAPEELREEASLEARGEEDDFLFCPDDDAPLSFGEKIDVVLSSTLALPANEAWEEEETADIVLEGGFVMPSDEEETEEEDSSLASFLPSMSRLSFAKRVSLPSWGEELAEETEAVEATETVSAEETSPRKMPSAEENADETERLAEQDEALPEEAPLPWGEMPDALPEEEPEVDPLACEECAPLDEGSPPDSMDSGAGVGLTAEPLPYSYGRFDKTPSMVFERVKGEEKTAEAVEEETALPPTPVVESEPLPEQTSEETETAETVEEKESVEPSEEKKAVTVEENHRSPRIQLAPAAYRASKAVEEKATDGNKSASEEESEDFMSGIPGVMRHFLEDFPFGRTNRVQSVSTNETKTPPVASSPKKRKRNGKHASLLKRNGSIAILPTRALSENGCKGICTQPVRGLLSFPFLRFCC